MKKIILIVAFFVFSATFAQETTKKIVKKSAKKSATANVDSVKFSKPTVTTIDGPSMLFVTETVDYGNVTFGGEGKREFVVTNNGNKPLIISKLFPFF